MFRNLIARLFKRDRVTSRQLSRSQRREAFLHALQSRTSAEVATWSNVFKNIVQHETRRRSASFQSYLMPALQMEALEQRVLLAFDAGSIGNIGNALNQLYVEYQTFQSLPVVVDGGGSFTSSDADKFRFRSDEIYVEARGRGDFNTWLVGLQGQGLDVVASASDYGLVEGFLPIGNLAAAASRAGTISVLPVWQVSPTDSQGTVVNGAERP